MDTTKTSHVKTLILGGGITGLATAWALQKKGDDDYLVLEAKPVPGGLCATTFINGYHFDYGGHFLHLHTPQGKKLVKQLLGRNLQKHTRRAFIYTYGRRIPFPFQANLWAIDPRMRDLAVYELNHYPPSEKPPQNFEQWCVQSFGSTLNEAFFRPYNEKLWGRKQSELTADWCGPFVPTLSRQEILKSAYKKPTRTHGYNAQFFYPKTGGCGALIDALVKRVKHLRLNTPVTHIDLARKTAWSNGEQFTFTNLVSTLPLPQLVHLLHGHEDLKRQADLLKVQPITIYHLALLQRAQEYSWIYFPDVPQPFYRVGFTNVFDPGSVPFPFLSFLYIELPGLPPTSPETEKAIWDGLYQKSMVDEVDSPIFSAWQTIPYAYVVFDKNRAEIVPGLLRTLENQHCYCAGRYGRWEYSFMESSLLQAEELAKKLAR